MSVNPKHQKYQNICIPGEEYWGIGIENESYIELSDGIDVEAEFVRTRQSRERYSVNYWTQYKPGIVEKTLMKWSEGLSEGWKTKIHLPLLLNGHSFTKCDCWGEHKTTYEVTPRPNPKCASQTLLERLAEVEPTVFGPDEQENWWTFDGDTVEFMTRGFYRAKMEDVVEELKAAKERWMTGLIRGLEKLPRREKLLQQIPRWPKHNYGLAVFASNRRNVAIFNNGTYHFNFTLPTFLDKDGNILNWPKFVEQHRMAARMFQWLSPFLVAKWGSPDVFANLTADRRIGEKFPAGSQRLAASRYVSLGTYDTVEMPTGKQLVEPVENIRKCEWRQQMYDSPTCAYQALEYVGFDINFNKFKNHGLEFRIFDWFSEESLMEIMRLLVWMLDASLDSKKIPVPQKSPHWNSVVRKAIWDGSSGILTQEECRKFGRVLGVQFPIHALGTYSILDGYTQIWETWADVYNSRKGGCSEKMLKTRLFRPIPPQLRLHLEKIPPKKSILQTIVRLKPASGFTFRKEPIRPIPPKKLNKQTQTTQIDVVVVEASVCCGGFFQKKRKEFPL